MHETGDKQGRKQAETRRRRSSLVRLRPGTPLRLDEALQVPRRYTNRVQNAHVRKVAVTYQLVHGRRTHAELGGHVAHRKQRAGSGSAPPIQYAEPPRPLQQGCSKNLAKGGYRRHALDFAADYTCNEIARLRRRATPRDLARCSRGVFPS